MALPDDYTDTLAKLGEAFAAYETATGVRAVLVGGAAAAVLTDGEFMSADFDVLAANDIAFTEAMEGAGFEHDKLAGHGDGGWFHPSQPRYVVEQVSGRYFDGRGDKGRCLQMRVREGSTVVLPAVEDIIADRLGQHEVSQGDASMLEQARALYTIAQDLDVKYLVRRILEESGNPALLGLSRD
ncbi:hypothetical protein GCM10023208_08200 [Erythrobacter westpacificensis]|uniref:Nucleotidyltransferase family protein n=1 Tax=Erythrobacter westpacificensis TaxID=1055231 RepID=A0ABP9K254_9SPHN